LAKQVGKWISLKVTKGSFSKGISRAILIVSGFPLGVLTVAAMKKMVKKLRLHLAAENSISITNATKGE